MNTKNEKAVINDKNLESVTGGIAAPSLPATELPDSCFEGSSLEDLASPNFPSPEIDVNNKNSFTRPVGFITALPAFP